MSSLRYHEDRVDGVRLGVFRSTPAQRLPPHGHDDVHLCVMLDGSLAERDRGRDRALEPGGLRLSPAGDEHRIRFGDAGGRCLLVMVPAARFDTVSDGPLRTRRFRAAVDLLPDVVDLASDIQSDRPPGTLAVESLLALVAARTASGAATSAPPRWLVRAREHMREAPESVARLADLAEAASIHPGHLVRAFRAHFGCTPGDYLRLWRVERARRRVAGTDWPLASVAVSSGFADQAHMTREFRRRLGVTPGALRRSR